MTKEQQTKLLNAVDMALTEIGEGSRHTIMSEDLFNIIEKSISILEDMEIVLNAEELDL